MTSIPDKWLDFWEPVDKTPTSLTHFTSPHNAKAILETGYIKPFDPTPRDWSGLQAVFMCDQNDPSFLERFQDNLTPHFYKKDSIIDAFSVNPIGEIFRCKLSERRSYYISLEKIPVIQVRSHYPFSCKVK